MRPPTLLGTPGKLVPLLEQVRVNAKDDTDSFFVKNEGNLYVTIRLVLILTSKLRTVYGPGQVGQLLEHHQKVGGSIPGQGIYLGCRFNHQLGITQEATNQCFSLTSMFLSTPPINKYILS